MIKIIFIITILFYSPNWVKPLEIPVITNIQDMIGLAHDVGDIASGNIPFKNLFNPAVNPMTPVLEKIGSVTRQIEKLDTKLDDLLVTIISRIPLEDNINTDIRNLHQYISIIDESYNEFLAYSQNISLFNNNTLIDFINTVTSTKPGNIRNLLNMIFNIIVPKQMALGRVGFLENLMQKRRIMTSLEICNPPTSFQHQLLQIYNLISITEMRVFIMITFAYRLRNEFENVKSIGEINRVRAGFIMRLDQYLIKFRTNMLKASKDIFLCDPESLTDKETYVEFEGLFTAYVMNEDQMTTDTCSNTCSEIKTWLHRRCYIRSDQNYCTMHYCYGLIYDCGWIGGDVDICEYYEDSPKRYEWIRSYTNGWYGEWTRCDTGKYRQISSRYSGLYSCDLCVCRCEEAYGQSKAIRTFSLRPQITNIDENKVVSDVKFVMKDKMIHIQIEEASLLPIGQLDRNQSSWVPLEDFMYLSNSSDGDWVQVKDGQYIPMTRGIDYAFIIKDQRILNLDVIEGGPNFVLTGVRLKHELDIHNYEMDRRSLSPLQLQIHVTPFDYSSGKLIPTEENPSVWLTSLTQPKLPPAYAEKRQELTTGGKAYRFESAKNPHNLKPNQYIQFKQSSFTADAGQSTMPFMDARPTAPSSPIAFDGLGLIYRGHDQYGGFVALKATTIDLTNYMDASMTAEQRKYYIKNSNQPAGNIPLKKKNNNNE